MTVRGSFYLLAVLLYVLFEQVDGSHILNFFKLRGKLPCQSDICVDPQAEDFVVRQPDPNIMEDLFYLFCLVSLLFTLFQLLKLMSKRFRSHEQVPHNEEYISDDSEINEEVFVDAVEEQSQEIKRKQAKRRYLNAAKAENNVVINNNPPPSGFLNNIWSSLKACFTPQPTE